MNRNILRDNRGAFIVFVALFLLLILLFTAVSIEVGWTTFVRNQGQARVDAAALAGASAISDGQIMVETRANTFSDQNTVVNSIADPVNNIVPILYEPGNPVCGANGICKNGVTYANANGIEVSNSIPTPLFFARLLNGGVSTTTVNVTATAIIGYTPNLPLVLLDCQVPNPAPGTCANLTLTGAFTSQSPSPADDSAFTCYYMTASANNCKALVDDPSITPCLVPGASPPISVNNGQVSSCLNSIEQKFDSQGSPWEVIVPIISCAGLVGGAQNPTQSAKIVRLTKVNITKIVTKGPNKRIEGQICGGGLTVFPACTRLVE